MTGDFVSEQRHWIALTVALLAVFVLQVWAGFALRGLFADGAYYAQQLAIHHAFVVIEPSRWTSQMLMQAPVILAMALGADTPQAVAVSFSLSTNLMPMLLTLLCFAALPPGERAFGLFPVFVFLAASMSAAVASVADGPTAAAYAWLLLILVMFGRLSPLRLAAILVLAAGAVRLHEATAFLGPILVVACLTRCRASENPVARAILILAGLLVATGCGIAVHDVLHPRVIANRGSFITDVVSGRWLILAPGQVSILALSGLVAPLCLPLAWLRGRALVIASGAVGVIFAVMAVLAFTQPACPPAAFAARDNACLLSLPAMILLWALRHRPPPPPTAALAIAMLGAVIAVADGAATAGWLGYTDAMRTALTSERGVIPWGEAVASLPPAKAEAMRRFSWPWTAPLMSLWLAPGAMVHTIIANPTPIVWQPFDPYAVKAALASGDTPPTSSALLISLGRLERRARQNSSRGARTQG